MALLELIATYWRTMSSRMDTSKSKSPVYLALKGFHQKQDIFSYGISDNPGNISLYEPSNKGGVIVTGKPSSTVLPRPFDKVKNVVGIGYQIHHKFLVCGFNRPDAVVYCGSSNSAPSGEAAKGAKTGIGQGGSMVPVHQRCLGQALLRYGRRSIA
jgi:hypothetical protein